jgi:flagellar biosynthesis/type III secretory pathway protein FliH
MSSLITSDTELLHPPTWRASPTPAQPARDPELERLEAQVLELQSALTESAASALADLERARVETRAACEASFASDEAARLVVVEATMREAVDVFKARAGELEGLALLICETALEKVFARPGDFKDLVQRAIEVQIGAIHRDALVRLHVSGDDFADADALQALAHRIGAVDIAIDRELASGQARLIVRLGEIEISIERHWTNLKRKLRDLAGESAHP